MRDQLMFSVVAILVLAVVLRVVGVRSSIGSLVLSIVLTLLLNVGLSYWAERRARGAQSRPAPRDADIRWRDEQR